MATKKTKGSFIEDVMTHFQRYKSLTVKDAFERYGSFELRKVVSILSRKGWVFDKKDIKFKTRHGRIGEYRKYTFKGVGV